MKAMDVDQANKRIGELFNEIGAKAVGEGITVSDFCLFLFGYVMVQMRRYSGNEEHIAFLKRYIKAFEDGKFP